MAEPLRVGHTAPLLERFTKRRQLLSKVRIFVQQRMLLPVAWRGAGHFSHEMHHCVAMTDIDIEFVERVAPEVFKILLHLHFNIVPRKVST